MKRLKIEDLPDDRAKDVSEEELTRIRGGWLPEVDDEVLVVFAQGNVRQPYVIGSFWNGTDRPPTRK